MCGIAGILTRGSEDGNHSGTMDRLQRMTRALKHRGPNGEAFWVNLNASAGFGHRRLSIIDLSHTAAQPMHFPSGDERSRYTIVHNGEIYNYIEIREVLQKKGYTFRTQSDTEVILAAYDCWNDECVDYFDGMFAFGIWDEKEKIFFAARDRFGEKPFFYYYDEKELVFGSEMKALWAAGIERRPNLQMLFNFITIAYTGNPEKPGETFYENIHKLPAATTLTFYAGKNELVLEKYWDIDPEEQDKKISEAEAIETFKELFCLSVKRRLRSDVTVGSSLSGGLDSSAVISQISQLNTGTTFEAFTAVFPGYEKDESLFSRQVARQFNWKQNTIEITTEDMRCDWEEFCRHQEEPVTSASALAQFKVFELARQKGCGVLLDGQGADETLGGYHKYYKWYWQELFHKRKLYGSHELAAAQKLGVTEKFGVRNVIAALFPDLATVILERQYLVRAIRQEDLERDFVRLQSKEAYYSTPAHFTLNGALYFNTAVQGLEELLRYADRNSMAHGREIRLPFLSHELVEFIFSLPSHFKIHDGWTKWILRKSMNEYLQPNICWRKDKIGFEPPQAKWMENPQLQEMIRIARQTLANEKILRPEVVDKPIRILSSNAPDNFDWRYLAAAETLYPSK